MSKTSADEPLNSLIEKLRDASDLTAPDVRFAVSLLLSEQVAAGAKAEFLTLLHQKGETTDEITNFARELIGRAINPGLELASSGAPVIDVCGTGGDGFDLFNVSTAVMFVVAAAGAVVVKHGNRGVTSKSGSADVLEALGVDIDLEPEDLQRSVRELGFGFIYARRYHPAFRALAEMRQHLAQRQQRTIFNVLGPLLNPARPATQLIGVYHPRLTTTFAEVLRALGTSRAWVVHGLADDIRGVDDVSTVGPTTIAELTEHGIKSAVLDTQWLGIPRAKLEDLSGGDANQNAATITRLLSGDKRGAKYDYLVVNSAAALVVAGLAHDMSDAIVAAREQIDSGRAMAKLRALQSFKAAAS